MGAALSAAVTRSLPRAQHAWVVAQILRLAAGEPHITARSARALLRALRHERLVVAFDGTAVVGWFLSEPCGRGVQELGFIHVAPGHTGVMLELMHAGLAIEPTTVSVTFRTDFAAWLIRSRGFRRVTLAEAARASNGWFLLRRLAPSRLGTALRRTSSGDAWYLVRES